MKRNFLLVLLMASIFSFGFYGVVLGDGGGEEPPPYNPLTDSTVFGAYIKGFFTAAYDKQEPIQNPHYNVHVLLKWETKQNKVRVRQGGQDKWIKLNQFLGDNKLPIGRQTRGPHLLSLPLPVTQGKNLCKYEETYLQKRWWDKQMEAGVAKAFGWPSAEVYLSKVKKTGEDFCGDPTKVEPEAMIMGELELFLYTKALPPTKK